MATASKVDLRAIIGALLDQSPSPAAAAVILAERMYEQQQLREAVAQFVIKQFSAKQPTDAKPPRQLHARRRQGPKRIKRDMPTDNQKKGALKAAKVLVENVFDRKIRGGRKLGDVRVHELRAIAEQAGRTAASFSFRGYEDAAEMFMCIALSHHCVASDPFAKVRDVIKPKVAADIIERAEIVAAEEMRDGADKLAKSLIAAAHKPGALEVRP